MNEIGRHGRQPIIIAVGPSVFDSHISAIRIPGLSQTLEKHSHVRCPALGRRRAEESDHRHRLLRSRRQRQRHRRAHNKTEKLPTPNTDWPPRLRNEAW
jgi:hypothetical protein